MQRWFLSYHSPDQALAERLKAAIERKDSASRVFFAPTHLRAGGSWSAQLAQEIADANAFILLIGAAGIGKWQVPEYDEALDKWVNSGRTFPLIVVLLEGQTAPGLPFLRQLHWIVTPDPTFGKIPSRAYSTALPAAASIPASCGVTLLPIAASKRWRRRTATISSAASAETVEVLSALAGAPDRLPVLIGNSGVGKSSLAQAGVLAALKRQAWPEDAGAPNAWPAIFRDSRQWCFLSLKPGTDPLKALVEVVPRHLAIRGNRSRTGEAPAWLDRAAARRQGHAVRSDRRHRAPPPGTRSTQAARLFSLRRPGRGALRARRGAPTPALLRTDRAGAARPAPARDDEHALRLPWPSAERQAAVQGAPATSTCRRWARRSCARSSAARRNCSRPGSRPRDLSTSSPGAPRRIPSRTWAPCRSCPTRSTTCGHRW